MFQVSRRSAEIFGRSSQFYIPHNWYYDLAHSPASPTMFQILALSHITGYRLVDWLAALGFDLDAIVRLQLEIRWQHTTILDSTVFDPDAWVSWFAQRPEARVPTSIAPLTRFITWTAPRRAIDLLALNKKKFLYAIVGEQDFYAVPYFGPRSIARVNRQRTEPPPVTQNTNRDGPFFLLEEDFGWTCSRLVQIGKDRVLLQCPQRPCAEREVHVGKDARILGVVDAEIRRLTSQPCVGSTTAKPASTAKLRYERTHDERPSLNELLRSSRTRMGLSFRDASVLSRRIAETLSDGLYFAAASTLSDYEALSVPPRHIQKIITLCLLYRIGFEQFLRVAGFPVGLAGPELIPDKFVPRLLPRQNRSVTVANQSSISGPNGLGAPLLNLWEEIPLFLRSSLDGITGLKNFSLSDVFWVGGDEALQHPLLANSNLIVINRRARKPPTDAGNAGCELALYLILRRDGRYLCGRCTLDEGTLTIHGYPGGSARAQQFKNGVDAEVVGQLTTILRRLL